MSRRVTFHKYFNEELRTRRRGILVKQKVKEKYKFEMIDYDGNAININDLANEYSQSSLTAKLAIREASMIENVIIEDDATIEDAAKGEISFVLPEEVRKDSAVYHAELGLLGDNGEDLFAVNSLYIYVEPTNWTSVERTLPRLDEIRLSLKDSSFVENELLGNYEFDVAEISYAVTRTVQYWNETPPDVTRYSTKNFPFKNIWLVGTQLFLFEALEEHYRRNQLPYNAGGLTIDDKNKFQFYRAAWQDRFNRFARDVHLQKVRINTSSMASLYGPATLYQF